MKPPKGAARVEAGAGLRAALVRYGSALIFIGVLLAASQASPVFLSPNNLANVLSQVAITGIIGLGMTLVILTGGIDLSVGAVVALVSVLMTGTQQYGFLLSVTLALAVGAVVGWLNGVGVVYGRMQPFIMTLGMMTVARGAAFVYSGGAPKAVELEALNFIGMSDFAGVPIPGLIFAVLLVVTGTFMARVPAGRHIYAIGSNPDAARMAGVNVSRHLIGVYTFSGVMAAVGGIVFVAQQGVGMAVAGVGYELNAIAAVVLGGASLFGGEGTLYGTALGAAIIGVLGNMMNLSGVNPFAQDLLKGVIIISVVLIRRVLSGR